MDSAHECSIFSLVDTCDRCFQLLNYSLSREDRVVQPKVQDECGRLRVWAGTLGAHLEESDTLSFDHRLQKAPSLRLEVIKHLCDLCEAIQNATKSFSGEIALEGLPQALSDASDISDSDEFWDDLREEESHYSPMNDCLNDITHIITSLKIATISLQQFCKNGGLSPSDELAKRLIDAMTRRHHIVASYKLRSNTVIEDLNDDLIRKLPRPTGSVGRPPPKHACACQICHETVYFHHENDKKEREFHIQSDLQPYICTFGNCMKANQMYGNYADWSEHERQVHRREWFCGLCSHISTSEPSFYQHLKEFHADDIPEEQRNAVVRLSERPITLPQVCPLCLLGVLNPEVFQAHLGQHLEYLAALSLQPAEYINEEIYSSDLYQSEIMSNWSDWEWGGQEWRKGLSISSLAELLLPKYQSGRFEKDSSKVPASRQLIVGSVDLNQSTEWPPPGNKNYHARITQDPDDGIAEKFSVMSNVSGYLEEIKQPRKNMDITSFFKTQTSELATASSLGSGEWKPTFSCPLCEQNGEQKILSGSRSLETHLMDHLPRTQKPYSCSVASCGKSFNRRDRLFDHLVAMHALKTRQVIKQTYQIERVRLDLRPPAMCPICLVEVSSWDEIFMHLEHHCTIQDDSKIWASTS